MGNEYRWFKKKTLYEFKTSQGALARPKLTSLLPDDEKLCNGKNK